MECIFSTLLKVTMLLHIYITNYYFMGVDVFGIPSVISNPPPSRNLSKEDLKSRREI